MTPRKELFESVKNQLLTIPDLEFVDLFRDQFSSERNNLPDVKTAALVKINSIKWETGLNHIQEGVCETDIVVYCKDGWMEQGGGIPDPDKNDLDILDLISEKIQFLKGEQFAPLQQTLDEVLELKTDGIMGYRISFITRIYQRLNYNYNLKKVSIKV